MLFTFTLTDLSFQISISLFLIITTCYFIKTKQKCKRLPPGPTPFPFIGNKLQLGRKMHIATANLRKTYGDVIRIYMGSQYIVILTSYKAIKEALVKKADIFSGRPTNIPVPPNQEKNLGIIRGNGETWAELRKFSLSKLKDFGWGKSTLEPHIKDEVDFFLKELEKFQGKPIADIGEILRKSISNVICIIMTGKRYKWEDQVFNDLLNLTNEYLRRVGIDRIVALIPKPLRFNFLLKSTRIHSMSKLMAVFSKIVNQSLTQYEEDSQHNFIDTWFTHSHNQTAIAKILTKEELATVLLDLFTAGSDTTTNTLAWAMLYMIEYPHIQDKVRKEVDEVTGGTRPPCIDDQKAMPYTEAVLMEVSRISTIVPLSLAHCANADTELNGFFIPKGTTVVPNLWAVHHDEEIFPEPHEFKPERFLMENKQVKRMEELIPFSLGKRQCMGLSLARMELFLYFTSMIQRFIYKKLDSSTVDFDCNYSTVTTPKPHPICVVLRE